MNADRPETISYWSLDLRVRDPHPDRGDIPVNDDNVNDLILLAYNRWEWQAPMLYDLAPSRKGRPPVLPTLQATQVQVAVNLSLVGDKKVFVRGDRIVFYNSGLTALVDQGEQLRVLTEPVDGTENVSLMASVAGIVAHEPQGARRSDDATPLPVAAHQPFERAGTIKRLRDFHSVQPIFYLEQSEGFVLLAEAFQSAEERRLIYTLRAVVDDTSSAQTNGRPAAIADAQVKATTPAFRLADSSALHTIRAHQDGNLGTRRDMHKGYLEFWVNGLPLGIRRLPDARFRFRGGPARLYIGAWPRADGPLYLTGEIVHINFDPINKCTPC
ncbi:MAG: hypothetical protein KA170_17330 [Candidatus Promineofilum sp.]|jgi:hypothetical protein|nr:hypothetical protein [Promineifilum sp.]